MQQMSPDIVDYNITGLPLIQSNINIDRSIDDPQESKANADQVYAYSTNNISLRRVFMDSFFFSQKSSENQSWLKG